MKKISFVVLICILCSWFMVGCDKSYTYEEAYNIVINDIEENGEDIGEGYKAITQSTSILDEEIVVSVKDDTLIIGLLSDIGGTSPVTCKLSYSTYLTFHDDESDTHYYQTSLTVDGSIEGTEYISGVISASSYIRDTEVEYSTFDDPYNLSENGVIGADELANYSNDYLDCLLDEFEKYLNGIEHENLTIKDFGFESYIVEDE